MDGIILGEDEGGNEMQANPDWCIWLRKNVFSELVTGWLQLTHVPKVPALAHSPFFQLSCSFCHDDHTRL